MSRTAAQETRKFLPAVLALLLFAGCVSTSQLTPTPEPEAAPVQTAVDTAATADSVQQAEEPTVSSTGTPSSGRSSAAFDRAINRRQAVPDTSSNPTGGKMAARSAAEIFRLPTTQDTLVEGVGDSTTLDSARIGLIDNEYAVDNDSVSVAETTEESELDTSIYYGGRELLFDVNRRASIIRGNARIQYKAMTLSAYEILVDWENDLMTAVPLLDTLWTDSTETVVDTVKIVGMPTFKQGGTTMSGMLMRVNMKTKAGYVEGGTTQYGEGWYNGKRIQKVSDDVFFVQDGSFTSCKLDHPHFHFAGSEMKMIRGDKVVGKPVVLEFGDVPVAALPFAVFSIKPGRHSGILIPTYGDNSSQGRSLQNFGYYWAASEYWDIKNIIDYFEESGFRYRGNLIYKKTDSFNGSLSGSYQLVRGQYTQWNIVPVHRQQFNKYTSLNVRGDFVSSNNFYKEQSTNINQQLTQTIKSNATFQTRLPNDIATLSVNLSQSKNLVSGNSSETLPNISMNFGSHQLFPTEESKRSKDKNLIYQPPQERIAPGEERPEDPERWYNKITYTYSNNAQFKRDRTRSISDDYTSPFIDDEEGYIKHRSSISAPQRIFKYFTLNPSMSVNEDWMFERYNWYFDSTGTVKNTKEEGFFARHTFNTSLSSNTKFYGMFPVGKWGVEMIRHVVSPSVGMSWRPDFSDREWGYYQRISGYYYDEELDSTVYEDEILDRYNGSAAGGTSRGRTLSANFSLGNLFQMKTLKVDAQGKEQERKLDLFKVDMSTSYNFLAEETKWNNLSTRISSNPISSGKSIGPINRLSVDMTMRHSFYAWDYEENKEVDEFFFGSKHADQGDLLRLVNLSSSASFGMTVQNPFLQRKSKVVFEEEEPDTMSQDDFDVDELRNEFDTRYNDLTELDSPIASKGARKGGLDLTGSLNYTMNRSNPENISKSLFLRGNLSFKLTRNWTFRYSTGVNLITREVTVGRLYVERDLHCWSMKFSWTPTGVGDGIFLHIGVKAGALRDLKWEHKTGRGGVTL